MTKSKLQVQHSQTPPDFWAKNGQKPGPFLKHWEITEEKMFLFVIFQVIYILMPFISILENWNLLHSNFDVHEEPKASTKHLHGGHGFAKSFRKNRLQAKLQLRVKKFISSVFSQCLQKGPGFLTPKSGGFFLRMLQLECATSKCCDFIEN